MKPIDIEALGLTCNRVQEYPRHFEKKCILLFGSFGFHIIRHWVTQELLQKMGPAWLTKAFHAAGAFQMGG